MTTRRYICPPCDVMWSDTDPGPCWSCGNPTGLESATWTHYRARPDIPEILTPPRPRRRTP